MVERLPMHTRPRMLAHVHAKMRLIINFAFTFYTKGPARIARFCKLVRRADPRGARAHPSHLDSSNDAYPSVASFLFLFLFSRNAALDL